MSLLSLDIDILLSGSSKNNLELLCPARGSTIFPGHWRSITDWIERVSEEYTSDFASVLVNGLMLLSDCKQSGLLDITNYQLYSIVCLQCSAYISDPIHFISDSQCIELCVGLFTLEQLRSARVEIVQYRKGRLRFLTVVDVLEQCIQDCENEEQKKLIRKAIIVAVICVLNHPTFTTYNPLIFAKNCILTLQGVEDEHTVNILGSIQKQATSVNFNDFLGKYGEDGRELMEELSTRSSVTTTLCYETTPIEDPYVHLGDYSETITIDNGAYGEVFLVDRGGGTIVVKRQKLEELSSSLKELNIMASYKHPNLVQFLGFRITQDILDIEMEVGVPLTQVLFYGEDHSGISSSERKSIANDIVQGVKYLHSIGVLHNDIKPDNVIIVEGKAKLIDFGISQCMVLSSKRVKERNITIQTITYRAPELLLPLIVEEEYKEEVLKSFEGYCYGPDIWAVGALLLCIETGITPFPSIVTKNSTKSTIANAVAKCIASVLGSPREDSYKYFPFKGIEYSGLDMLEDDVRTRILGMLQYDPEKRVLA